MRSIEAVARTIVRDGTAETNVECLSLLFDLPARADALRQHFGGSIVFGQGAMPDAVYGAVCAVQRQVTELRGSY